MLLYVEDSKRQPRSYEHQCIITNTREIQSNEHFKNYFSRLNWNGTNDRDDCINNLDHLISSHLQNLCIFIRFLIWQGQPYIDNIISYFILFYLIRCGPRRFWKGGVTKFIDVTSILWSIRLSVIYTHHFVSCASPVCTLCA